MNLCLHEGNINIKTERHFCDIMGCGHGMASGNSQVNYDKSQPQAVSGSRQEPALGFLRLTVRASLQSKRLGIRASLQC